MPEDRITHLADALEDITTRLTEITTTLRTLEPPAHPASPTLPPRESHPPDTRVQHSEHASPTLPTPESDTGDTEPVPTVPFPDPMSDVTPDPRPDLGSGSRWRQEGVGARALAWVGGVVTLAGILLLLVLAVQRGYLGPLPRVLIGAGFGVALLGIGLRLHRNPAGHTGALACAATGVTVLYLDIVATTTLFGFVPPAAGLLIALVVAALGVLLADHWHAEPLAVFVVVCCAVAAPVLTSGFTPMLLGFLLVIQLGATPVHLARRWPDLCLASALPALLASAAASTLDLTATTDSLTVAFLGLVTSVAQIGVATAGAARRTGDASVIGLVLLAPVPAMLSAFLVPRLLAIVLPGTVGALLLLVWVLGYRRLPSGFAMAAGGAGSVAVLQATLTAFDGSVVAIVLLAQALLLTLVAHAVRYPAALWAAGLFGFTGLGAALLYSAPPALLVVAPVHPVPTHVVVTAGLTGLLLTVTAVAMCVVGRDGLPIAGLVALYGVTATILASVWLVSPDRTGFLVGHALVTVSWTVGALVLLVRGIGSAFARVAGMSLVGAALVKLVLFDLSFLDGMARVAAFLVAGLVLLAAGTRYAKLLARDSAYGNESRNGR